MLVTVITVTVMALSVIVLVMMVVIRFVAVLLLFQAEGHGDLVPGRQVEPVLLLQLPPGLVSLCLQLSQGSTDKLLLLEDTKCKCNSDFSYFIYLTVDLTNTDLTDKSIKHSSPSLSGSQSLLG